MMSTLVNLRDAGNGNRNGDDATLGNATSAACVTGNGAPYSSLLNRCECFTRFERRGVDCASVGVAGHIAAAAAVAADMSDDIYVVIRDNWHYTRAPLNNTLTTPDGGIRETRHA
jgi:hypothetical protein